jgi:hypothetical protein
LAFGAAFPEYGAGASYFMYLGNRSAQADALRAQLEATKRRSTSNVPASRSTWKCGRRFEGLIERQPSL